MIVLCLNFWRTSIVFHRLTLSKADQPRLKTFQHLQIRSKPLPSLKGPCMIWPPLLPPPLLLTLLWPRWPLYCSRNKQNGIPPKATAPPVLSAWEAFPQDPPTAPSSLPFGSQPEGPLLKAAFPWLLSSRSPLQHQFFVKKNPSRSSPTSTQQFLPPSFHRTLCIFHHSHYYPPPHHHC